MDSVGSRRGCGLFSGSSSRTEGGGTAPVAERHPRCRSKNKRRRAPFLKESPPEPDSKILRRENAG